MLGPTGRMPLRREASIPTVKMKFSDQTQFGRNAKWPAPCYEGETPSDLKAFAALGAGLNGGNAGRSILRQYRVP
jgi:hypothetical protein